MDIPATNENFACPDRLQNSEGNRMKFEDGQRPYIIAEIGANHNGDMDLARKHIDVAKQVGADSVKFQSWDKTLFSKKVYDDNYFLADDYRNRTDHTLETIVEEFALTREQLGELAAYCHQVGIDFASTPFEPSQVDPLVEFGAPWIKIASMDINNDRLLQKAGETGLPVVVSTGMASLGEIDDAVVMLEAANAAQIVLLHCTALYPTPVEEANLRNIETLRQFGHPVGFSDHSLGPTLSLAAVALGAVVIEKHYTLDKEMFGWDHKMSMSPDEMQVLVEGSAQIHAAMGSPRRAIGDREMGQRAAFRRSIVAARAIAAGEILTTDCVTYRRPGTGIDPSMAAALIGMKAVNDIPDDSMISMNDLAAAED
jgi:sialic acid synthase SpsE